LLFNAPRGISVPCGRLDAAAGSDGTGYEYAIRYISNRQRGTFEARLGPTLRAGRLVQAVRIGGVTYAELWALGEPPLGLWHGAT
jgi:hypothetical protein